MPLTAFIARHNVVTIDAYIFLTGSCGSTSTTLVFLYVLWRFPRFIKHVKEEGADPTVVVRLATFYQLNLARVVFRFMFTLPLLVLALDGIIGRRHIVNRNLFWTDFLLMIAGIGCFVSSTITLLIFFPRSIIREAGYKPKPSSTAANSPKSAPITPPALSSPFNAMSSHVQSPLFSPTTSQAAHLTMNMLSPVSWDSELAGPASPGESNFEAEMHQEHELEYDPESAPPYPHLYQRHPFPHSLSSPQVPSAPSSPHEVRVTIPQPVRYAQEPVYVSYRQNVGASEDAVHPMMRSTQSHDYKHAVITFTSPIDLIGIPDEVDYPRTI
ncbi:predicted protein [Sparassis crispa]|uniref:Uncharacterized protein n=1 Tax=Sparassis crispa TaxID=139825 RepID=A0A401GF68_9APHY|nr:predicted protein [Sparassis crispa]GBE80809.1 predicted protein [Sparassis crispa]